MNQPAGPVTAAATPPIDPRAPRNIVLFSDGTGNSSGKLQKTNVWRLYEALDLGYPTSAPAGTAASQPAGPVQLASYDDGVGTSSFRLLAALGGIFGIGLAANVRDLYRFLCRNYRPPDPASGFAGDRIYAFGFSRGAYTIRLLVAFIIAMGVIEYEDEAQLHQHTRDMWREYRRGFHTALRGTDLLVAIGRALLRTLIRLRRVLGRTGAAIKQVLRGRPAGARRALREPLLYAACARQHRPWWLKEWYRHWFVKDAPRPPPCGPHIEFVGVWDTVAAYGGPLVEIVRAIDVWIWPLSMPNYRLSPRVRLARHALAIDDKRDAFQPLLWDEVQEADMVAAGEVGGFPSHAVCGLELERLRQVWFAGMHADVGGGYSDESLSYVSLAWMIEHAEHAGLRLLPELRRRVFDLRNVFGPLHDSRGGLNATYRYQPRAINAWIDYPALDPALDPGRDTPPVHVRPATQIFRDPTIDGGRYRTRGLLRTPIALHASVEQRLQLATDGYAPVNLPSDYAVDDGVHGERPAAAGERAATAALAEIGDRIRLRRLWYFVSLVPVLLLVLKPFWRDIRWLAWMQGTIDSRTDSRLIASTINLVLPAFAERWTNAWAGDPYTTLLLVLALAGCTSRGIAHERTMADISRRAWHARFTSALKRAAVPAGARPRRDRPAFAGGPVKALARIWRTSDGWQGLLAWMKWWALPFALGLLLWLLALYAVVAVATQTWLLLAEQDPAQCPGRADMPVPEDIGPDGASRVVDIRDPCADLRLRLAPATTYQVTVETGAGWFDGDHRATPRGWVHPGAVSAGSVFLRRITAAPLFAPVLASRVVDPDDRAGTLHRYGDGIYLRAMALRPAGSGLGSGIGSGLGSGLGSDAGASPSVWQGTFTSDFPPGTGERALFFFVNDAVPPVAPVSCAGVAGRCEAGWQVFPLGGLYANNCGLARITITPVPRSGAAAPTLRPIHAFANAAECRATLWGKHPPR